MDEDEPDAPTTPRIRAPWAQSSRTIPARLIQPLNEFLQREATGGLVLAAAAIVALVWANVDPTGYTAFWSTHTVLGIGTATLELDLRHVVNDGLMALFFFVIGLEVKRELTTGELSGRSAALLPLFAAAGGMLVPAAVYLAIVAGDGSSQLQRGWGIPMATDIAFALGALALLGRRVPVALTALLLGIAVIDDIGAIIVIAVFYTDELHLTWMLCAAALLGAAWALQRLHVRALTPYVVLGIATWLATFESGIHATIAGVALGLLTPAVPFQRGDAVSRAAQQITDVTNDDPSHPDKDARHWRALAWLSREAASPLARLEHALHPWTSWVVLPIFALANVGITIDRDAVNELATGPVGLAIIVGLMLGKPLGITLGCLLATRTGAATLPTGVRWQHIVGCGALAGIGFTMSLFITGLAFGDGDLVAAGTVAVLAASIGSALVGTGILLSTRPRSTAS